MRVTLLSLGCVCLLTCSVFGQENSCPEYSDRAGLLQFLQDHRSNSLEADPQCVMRAFGSLSEDKSYTDALAQLLDFERNDKDDDALKSRASRYPAVNVMCRPYFVPYLVKAIKESDNEVVIINAAEAIDLVYRTCPQRTIATLESEASKPETSFEEQERLRAAEKHLNERLNRRPCKTESSNQ